MVRDSTDREGKMALPDLKGQPLPSLRELRAHRVSYGRRTVPRELWDQLRAEAREDYILAFGKEPPVADRPTATASAEVPKRHTPD